MNLYEHTAQIKVHTKWYKEGRRKEMWQVTNSTTCFSSSLAVTERVIHQVQNLDNNLDKNLGQAGIRCLGFPPDSTSTFVSRLREFHARYTAVMFVNRSICPSL